MFILDSDTATLATFQFASIIDMMDAARSRNEIVALGVFTWCEMLRGRIASMFTAANEAELTTAQLRLNETKAFLKGFTIVDCDAPAAAMFARLKSSKHSRKKNRGDGLLACIALANQAVLVTRNTKNFIGIPNLVVENRAV